MTLEDLQERLDGYQERIRTRVENALENDEGLGEMYEYIYSSERTEYLESMDAGLKIRRKLSATDYDPEVVDDIVRTVQGIDEEEYERMDRIDKQLWRYTDKFRYLVHLYGEFEHENMCGQRLQETLSQRAQDRHKRNARKEMLAICRERMTEANLPELIERLEICQEDHLFEAHDHTRPPVYHSKGK